MLIRVHSTCMCICISNNITHYITLFTGCQLCFPNHVINSLLQTLTWIQSSTAYLDYTMIYLTDIVIISCCLMCVKLIITFLNHEKCFYTVYCYNSKQWWLRICTLKAKQNYTIVVGTLYIYACNFCTLTLKLNLFFIAICV